LPPVVLLAAASIAQNADGSGFLTASAPVQPSPIPDDLPIVLRCAHNDNKVVGR
jgi:hypothetical protein